MVKLFPLAAPFIVRASIKSRINLKRPLADLSQSKGSAKGHQAIFGPLVNGRSMTGTRQSLSNLGPGTEKPYSVADFHKYPNRYLKRVTRASEPQNCDLTLVQISV